MARGTLSAERAGDRPHHQGQPVLHAPVNEAARKRPDTEAQVTRDVLGGWEGGRTEAPVSPPPPWGVSLRLLAAPAPYPQKQLESSVWCFQSSVGCSSKLLNLGVVGPQVRGRVTSAGGPWASGCVCSECPVGLSPRPWACLELRWSDTVGCPVGRHV